MPAHDYDVIIIGGGIHGCGIAQAAAAAGYDVLVLEQTALAAGTSSKSSKLIHGGLRYLETAQFRLVREGVREREWLLKQAPGLVRRVPFYIPVYRAMKRRPWQIRIGLSIDALFAGMGPETRFATVPQRDWPALGGINTDGLVKVFRYTDAQTDDAALTRAVMRSACELGAGLRCPASFISAHRAEEGYVVRFRCRDDKLEVSCRMLVNAAGPWVNSVLKGITPAVNGLAVDLVQGTHIVIRQPLSGGVVYVEAPRDRRVVLFMPWHGYTLIGTTETIYTGNPAEVHPHSGEIEYLLETLHHYFPDCVAEVRESFAGLRVLPKAEGAAFERSRETMIHSDNAAHPRLLNIYGGKLTTYCATAEKVVRRLKAFLGPRPARADVRSIILHAESPSQ
ncbi:MAG: FAD-dependent oxidoreductase [Mariprofundaceae bacterium]|nr:FAD-dependent oxidoreductase [Mariprofundaceae bacterium]